MTIAATANRTTTKSIEKNIQPVACVAIAIPISARAKSMTIASEARARMRRCRDLNVEPVAGASMLVDELAIVAIG